MEDCDGEIKLEDLKKLEFLERFIQESLRLYPSVPLISKVLMDDLLLSNKYANNYIIISKLLFLIYQLKYSIFF